jgi:thioredoxin-like negative regulator of GroEL
MSNIRVQFTIPNVEKMANLEVKINGEKRNMKFRIVNFDWNSETGSSEDLIEVLRKQIQNYDRQWELYHIGAPQEDHIPVTFRFQNS